MAKKIIVLAGSPRKDGNTNTVVQWFADAARKAGGHVDVIDTSALNYAATGCTECMGCQRSDKFECVIDDQASPVIARIPDYDVLVLATPVFWFGPSAQLKLTLDRTFALMKFDDRKGPYGPGKPTTLCLIATAGGDLEAGLNQVDATFRTAAVFMKCRYESLLVPLAPPNPTELQGRVDVKTSAAELGRRMATEA